MIKTYQRVPCTVRAVLWNGNNYNEVIEFCKGHARVSSSGSIVLDTLEGTVITKPLDYIVEGIDGEFYPCKKHVFDQIYKEVQQ